MEKDKKDKKDFIKIQKEIEDLRDDLINCQKEKDEYLNGWRREKADFMNYKKEESVKIKELLDYNQEKLILKILPILDNFNIAFKKIPDNLKQDSFVEGMKQIKFFLENFLKNEGVEEINSVGKIFDPFFHEAIEVVEDEKESGIIIKEIEKGYFFKGKLLRPSKVRVVK